MRTCGFLSSFTMAETPNNFSFSAKEISKTDLKVSEPQVAVCPVFPKGRIEGVKANCQFALPFSEELLCGPKKTAITYEPYE
jgi:hypothetical protein